jgi:hypothetical protein
MNNEPTTSAAPTGLLYGMYGALAMIVCSLLTSIMGGTMSVIGGIVSITATLGVIIGAMVMAIRHHRDTLQGGKITLLKAFTIAMLISFVIGLVSGGFMYLYYMYVDTSSLVAMLEKSQELFEKMGIPEKDMDVAMAEMKKNMTPFGIFRSSINNYLIMGAIVGIITSLIMKKEDSNPFLKSEQ